MLRHYSYWILTSGGSYEYGTNLGSVSVDGLWSVTLLLIIHEVNLMFIGPCVILLVE